MTCRHPDRDVPKLVCGYPLPCPWHTVVIDTTENSTEMDVPVQTDPKAVPRLAEIAFAVTPDSREDKS